MHKIKDRKIRVNNIPKHNIKYVLKGFNWRVLFLVFVLGIVLFLSLLNYVIAVSTLVVSLFYLRNIKTVTILELSDEALIYYLNEEEAIIIYYAEIINYRIERQQRLISVNFLLVDESSQIFDFYDAKVILMLEKMIGDKYVGK